MLRPLIVLMVCLLAAPAWAQQKDVISRLMAEPVSLFDWGMARLERDIDKAASRVVPVRAGRRAPRAGTIYDWRSGQITLYVSIERPPEERTVSACSMLFRDVVQTLIESAPESPDAAGWYLLNTFQPKGHFWASRFEDVGGKLLEVVRLEISIIPEPAEALRGKAQGISCYGRLDADPDEIEIAVTP